MSRPLTILRAAARSHRSPRSHGTQHESRYAGRGGTCAGRPSEAKPPARDEGPRGGHGHTRAAYPHGDAVQRLQP